ncbi:hypothetical protein ACHAWF_005076 [Thalassiosira exigua]
MAEGGLYPWKLQKIRGPANGVAGTCDYASDLSRPLPPPPEGATWVRDESTREWSLVAVATATAVASPSNGDDAEDDGVPRAAVVAVPVAASTAASDPSKSGARHHVVTETDTFQGICLRYKVTPTELRRANGMMGTNLRLAPETLLVPSNDDNVRVDARAPTREEKIASLMSRAIRFTKDRLSYSEARAYLDMADWDVDAAVEDVREDFGWSGEKKSEK